MKNSMRIFTCFVLFAAVLSNGFPVAQACGPYYLSPVFDYKYAPENPFADFADGKLGIVKPSYHRVVLIAAYRYLNGGTFTADERKALVDVWNADFNNKDFGDTDVSEAVKLWVEKRREILPKEETLPTIYTEKSYGGYDFFPNCTKNAFETAAQTLSDRAASYGADNQNVKNWVAAQDAVFFNCASNKEIPQSLDQTAPEWLQKDRAYQQAAAAFYSLDYEKAKADFAAIAQDFDSPWRDTADYLVARTLIRQASLISAESKRNAFYEEAELRLHNLSSSGGKFSASSEKFLNLIKYRLHPQERVGELARVLSYGNADDNFRQDLIDYYWLLDKFESETLEAEEKRKENAKAAQPTQTEEEVRERIAANLAIIGISIELEVTKDQVNLNGGVPKGKMADVVRIAADISQRRIYNNLYEITDNVSENKNNQLNDADNNQIGGIDKLDINFSNDDYSQHWTIYVNSGATDEEAIAEAEKVYGKPLTEKMKEVVKSSRQYAYGKRFSEDKQPDYQGGYSSEKLTSLNQLPNFLRRDEMTEWLFVYQMSGAEAYLYALDNFKRTRTDLWLMTAISKAEISSAELKVLLEAANRADPTSQAYPTIAFHEARILIAQGKQAEAAKILDRVLGGADILPVSSRNQLLAMRAGLAQTMDDFLRDSLKKPFGFESDGFSQTIDELIAQEKSYYDAESTKQTEEEFDGEVENRYTTEKRLQNELMFDDKTINIINEHFPTAGLLAAEKSPALPDYLRERFALAIWTRAVLLKDDQTANKIMPEIVRLDSENEQLFAAYLKAKMPVARHNAALFIILKNENFSPYIASGFGSSEEGYRADASRWWCRPNDRQEGEEEFNDIVNGLTTRPKFLTPAQSLAAQTELKQLKRVGDAPMFLGEQVLAWAQQSPLDKRVPEGLSIVYEANGWDKYGCGSNEELRVKIGNYLKKHYPDSSWTKQLSDDEQ